MTVFPNVVTVVPTETTTGASGSPDPDVVGGVGAGEPPVPVPPPGDVLVPPLARAEVATVTLVPAGTSGVTGGHDPVRVKAATVATGGAALVPTMPAVGEAEPEKGAVDEGPVGPAEEPCGDPVLEPVP